MFPPKWWLPHDHGSARNVAAERELDFMEIDVISDVGCVRAKSASSAGAPGTARRSRPRLCRGRQFHQYRRAYASDWKHFAAWCRRQNVSPDPKVVGLYITAYASGAAERGMKANSVSTIEAASPPSAGTVLSVACRWTARTAPSPR